MKLRGMREGQPRRPLGHGVPDFCDAVANVNYRGLPGRIEKASAGFIDYPTALPLDSERIRLAKISRKQSGVGRHGDKQIVAEPEFARGNPAKRSERNTSARPAPNVTVVGWRTFSTGSGVWWSSKAD